jgi:hypothetical protein
METTQTLFPDMVEQESKWKQWKIVHRESAGTTRLEKWSKDGKEFEILLTKEELNDLLTLKP